MKKQTDREQRLQQIQNGMGKLTPQDVETEEIVLGSLLISPGAIITVIDLLKPEIFYKESNYLVCEAILKLYQGNSKVDIMTVQGELRKNGNLEMVGGGFYLTGLMSRVSSTEHLQDHIRMVYEMYLLRQMITFFSQKINECYELTDPFNAITDSTRFLDELNQGTQTKTEVHISELSREAIQEREMNRGKVNETPGVSTGSVHLDKAIGGFQPEQLVIIAGRPGMGKTAFALSVVKSIGKTFKKPIAIFSLEMSAKQLYTRLQASSSEIDSRRIRYNNLTEEESVLLFQTDGNLSECPIYIDDTPALNIDRFRAKATIMKHKYGIEAIVVDYLQLMKGSKGNFNREAEISEISGKLKQVAKELKIPIIALSQLSREVEKRGASKLPQLSDLRDSGSIEQDADVVLFLWRPAYYNLTGAIEFSKYNMEILPDRLLAVIIAKQREGDTFNVPLEIRLNTMQISDHPSMIEKFLSTGEQRREEIPF